MTTPRVTVPVEPTEAMIGAYFDLCRRHGFLAHINATAAWRAMLSAAPAPEGVAVIPADEMTESALKNRAIALLKLKGWKAGDRIHMHGVIGLMTEFGMDVTNRPEEDRCGHPDCGCDFDQVCDAALATREEAPAEAGERRVSSESELKRIVKDLITHRRAGDYDLMADDVANCLWPHLRAQPPSREDGDEAYDLGKRDGYEQAVQDVDLLTGGDGEYVFATDGGGCPDAEAMKARIAERFQAREDAQPVGRVVAADYENKKVSASWSDWPVNIGTALYTRPAPDALQAAVEALEPFSAACLDRESQNVKTLPGGASVRVTLAQCRAARQALAALQAEQGAK